MPGFSKKSGVKSSLNVEGIMGLMNPAKIISDYAKNCGVEKLTGILIKMREQIDAKTMIEIDEAWNLSRRDPESGKYYCDPDSGEYYEVEPSKTEKESGMLSLDEIERSKRMGAEVVIRELRELVEAQNKTIEELKALWGEQS